jgi:riboflavin transporter FmnP
MEQYIVHPIMDESYLIILGGFIMTNNRTHRIVGIAMLAALAWLISMFSFPILPAGSFLKVDFSDIPVLFGMYIYGPVAGAAIAFIRSLLSYVDKGGEAGFPIGDSAAFIASMALTLPIYWIIRKNVLSLKTKLIAGFLGSVSLTVVLAILNWLVVAPAYMAVMGFDVGPMREYILYLVVPFNLLKGPIVTSVFFVGFTKLKPWLDKTRKRFVRTSVENLSYEN